MLNLITIDKPIRVNGVVYANAAEAYEKLKGTEGEVDIELNFLDLGQAVNKPAANENPGDAPVQMPDGKVFRLKVRQYMTQRSVPGFDFMKKHNNDKPMPLRVMVGTILEETKGMYKMELFARPEPSSYCLKCARTLTHPVSLLYGLGPECGGHFHINPLETKEELDEVYEDMKARLAEVKWTGWVVKSSIEEWSVVDA